MIDAVEWSPKHHGHMPLYWKPDMEASLDGKNFVHQDWAWIAGSIYHVPYEAVHGGPRPEVVEGETESIDPAEALQSAIMAVVDAVRDYLPPDGISEKDFISRVIGAVDNPTINPVIFAIEAALQECGDA